MFIIIYFAGTRSSFMNIERTRPPRPMPPSRSLNRTPCVYYKRSPFQFLIRETYRLRATRTFRGIIIMRNLRTEWFSYKTKCCRRRKQKNNLFFRNKCGPKNHYSYTR